MALAPAAFDKAAVVRNWRIRAVAWNRWAAHLERMAARFNEPLLDAAVVEGGHHVLDLASGIGEPALGCARRVGPAGSVTATDLLPEMLGGARRRAEAQGLANMRFGIADAEALPFPEAAFDRVTCRFGIMFCPDPARAMAEALRVLKPGGRTAWMVWGPRADTTLFDVIQRTVREVLELPPDPALPQFRFAAPGTLAAVMTDARFAEVAERDLWFSPKPAAGERFWEANLEMSFAEELQAITADQRAEVDRAVAAAFDAYLADGVYRLKAHVRIGAGHRPG